MKSLMRKENEIKRLDIDDWLELYSFKGRYVINVNLVNLAKFSLRYYDITLAAIKYWLFIILDLINYNRLKTLYLIVILLCTLYIFTFFYKKEI